MTASGGDPKPRANDATVGRDDPHLFETLAEDVARVHRLSLDRSDDGIWIIGRGSGASIVLPEDLEVSRRHAAIRWRLGHFEIVDLATSRNGTWVNGERLIKGRPRLLRAGDVVQLGCTELEFRA